jgi:hypothetical protein
MICFDILWLTRYATDHDAPLKFILFVTPFLPYGCYLGNSQCIAPPLVDPNVYVKLNYIFIKFYYIAEAPESPDVWIVFHYLKYCPNQTFIKIW